MALYTLQRCAICIYEKYEKILVMKWCFMNISEYQWKALSLWHPSFKIQKHMRYAQLVVMCLPKYTLTQQY